MAQSNADQNACLKKTREDFDYLKSIGDGSFSSVYLAKDKKSGDLYAIKECLKLQIIKEKKVKYIHLEKRVLCEFLNDHPFFVRLYFTCQDQENLYFGLTYCPNGDLLGLIKKYANGEFPIAKTIFYSAEIVDALEYMHSKHVIHRDLKPENILLDTNMHIKLTDFGTAKILNDPEEEKQQASQSAAASNQSPSASSSSSSPSSSNLRRKNSFVGTAQFVSPEILKGKDAHIGTDLWSFGCIVFQMISGKHMFSGGHEYDIFQKVVGVKYSFPEDLFSQEAKDLISRLVVLDPNERLGASESNGYDKLKAHAFFVSVNWAGLSEQSPP